MLKEINRIVNDERTYIESIAKQDKETVRAALADRGADTALRMCFGMTGEAMPIRVLGYFASALAVHEHYFPEAELQFIYPFRAAHIANDVDFMQSIKQIGIVDPEAKRVFARRFRTDHETGGKVIASSDFSTVEEELEKAVSEVLSQEPNIGDTLLAKSVSRGGNFASYVAAHVLMHDMNPVLQPIDPLSFTDFADETRPRVISIGAQSERPFYLARMACRRAKLLPEREQVETGQLFTRHVIPPYIVCREGESLLSSENTITTADDVAVTHPVASVARDLTYLHGCLQAEEMMGSFSAQSSFVDKVDRPKAVLGMGEVYYV